MTSRRRRADAVKSRQRRAEARTARRGGSVPDSEPSRFTDEERTAAEAELNRLLAQRADREVSR